MPTAQADTSLRPCGTVRDGQMQETERIVNNMEIPMPAYAASPVMKMRAGMFFHSDCMEREDGSGKAV